MYASEKILGLPWPANRELALHNPWRRCLAVAILTLAVSSARAQTASQGTPASGSPVTCRRSCSCRCDGVGAGGGNASAFVVQQPTKEPEADSKTRAKDLVPLFQSVVWALVVVGVLIGWRREIGGALRGGHIRVKAGGVEVEVFPPEPVTDTEDLGIEETEVA